MVNPYIRGRNAAFKLMIDGTPQTVRAKQFAVDEVVIEGVDSVNGEDRDRPYILTSYFEIGFQSYLEDLSLVKRWLDQIATEDAQTAPLNVVVGIQYNIRSTGTLQRYMATECTRRAMRIDAASRGEAVMFPSGFRARYFQATQ